MPKKITSIVTGYLEAVKTRVENCAPVTMDGTEHSVNSLKHMAYWETYIKDVELNELHVLCHASLLCIMCHFLKNK